MLFRTISFVAGVAFCLAPTVALAQGTTFRDVATTFIQTVITSLMGLFAAIAIAGFFYGIVIYLLGSRSGDSEKIKKGNSFVIWGLVALFVLSSLWGIIYIVQDFFGVTNSTIFIP